MHAPERVRIPRLTSRTGMVWGVGTLAVLVVGAVVLAVVNPAKAPLAVGVAVVALLLAVAAGSSRRWLEPERGRVTSEWLWVRSRSVDLADARDVRLVDNRGGGLNLTVRPARGRAMLVPVLLLSDYVERSQTPSMLRLLAEQVERFAPEPGEVPDQLRRQAEHLDAGGSAVDSPLAALD